MHIHRKFLTFILGVTPLSYLEIFKSTTEINCHRNSTITLNRISWKFVVDQDMLWHVHIRRTFWCKKISERTIRTLAKVLIVLLEKLHYVVQLVWNWFCMNDREAVWSDISEHSNVTQMWLLLIDLFSHYFLSDCPSVMYGALPFVIYSTVKCLLDRGVCELAHYFFHCLFRVVRPTREFFTHLETSSQTGEGLQFFTCTRK